MVQEVAGILNIARSRNRIPNLILFQLKSHFKKPRSFSCRRNTILASYFHESIPCVIR